MRVTHKAEDNAIRLEFDAVDGVEGFFDGVKEQQGFFLQLDRKLRQYQKLSFTAVSPPRFEFGFEAEVIQVVPGSGGFGTAFQLCWRPGQSKELHDKLQQETG